MHTYLDLENLESLTYEEEQDKNNLIDLDENIAYAIVALNKKGYKTLNCCEGHWVNGLDDYLKEILKNPNISYNYCNQPYIEFDNRIKLNTIPEGWTLEEFDTSIDENGNNIVGYWACIRADELLNAKDIKEFYELKMNTLLNLFKWIDTL